MAKVPGSELATFARDGLYSALDALTFKTLTLPVLTKNAQFTGDQLAGPIGPGTGGTERTL
ncbi:MAG: hypothetical protein ACKVOE_02345 [Rickettsiales bacterium]